MTGERLRRVEKQDVHTSWIFSHGVTKRLATHSDASHHGLSLEHVLLSGWG